MEWQSIDARSQHRLHGGRHLQTLERHRQTIAPRFARKHSRLDQRMHTLFEEEGIALGLLDEHPLEWCEARLVS